ncbi:MAG TPA: adenylate/guanylate cyclase domain-containing protein [Gaiellaceae bacterium]|jgi:class 3 adenylate cyclase/tetratricopeptide (TPR) repeat protein
MHCSACGVENPAGHRFCNACGGPLGAPCAACGAANPPGSRFCGSCGGPLAAGAQASTPVAERRVVSVLFADLVGFTQLSEGRDAEDVRELLSRYFETCRRLIEVYGGTPEKFIGDAVMAVWGAPLATEQDAERAVRAGLDLVAAVTALGDELGVEGLRARVGVLTGEAAVTVGAVGEGMVAGDLVNTAARIQSSARPGAVLVGDATRRATEATIVYEPAGAFELKGKQGETELWQALRVVSGAQGSRRSERLEAPFVGRHRELRQVKELFHASADERRAHLVSIVGIGGIGKSRLAWEFDKYVDGLVAEVWWHRGRCLAYGEGVAYWALADMVRMRCRIAEDDAAEAALAKLRATLEDVIADAGERALVEPRLAQLLGLGDEQPAERNELFAAWRLFFERLAEQFPVAMVFEDMQWADASLLDFVEQLLDWSRSLPIFVVTLARPELLDKRPTWGAGMRNFSAIHLEPLADESMLELLEGLVPGLPANLAAEIVERAAGVPLYAVETVRMLLDRGALVQEGSAYRLVGEIGSLEVPETLHALIASRLDGLPAEERQLLQDAAILGKTFTAPALAVLVGSPPAALEPSLTSLVRKEILGVQADPRSPEHGQYGFLQDLVRHVVYETLSKRERRARHLAAADALAAAMPEEEVAEVLAAHLAEAYALDPDAPDADGIRTRACGALVHAAERAASLGASQEASRYFARASELERDEVERAQLELRAGELSAKAGRPLEAVEVLERSIARFAAAGDRTSKLRAVVQLARTSTAIGRLDAALAVLEPALAELDPDSRDLSTAAIEASLGQVLALADRAEEAISHLDRAIAIADWLGLDSVLVDAVISKAIATLGEAPNQARMLLTGALEFAAEQELTWAWLRALNNLSETLLTLNRFEEVVRRLEEGVVVARRIGDREWEMLLIGNLVYAHARLGSWDEALRWHEEAVEVGGSGTLATSMNLYAVDVLCARGELDAVRTLLAREAASAEEGDSQMKAIAALARATLALVEDRPAEALATARGAIRLGTTVVGANLAVPVIEAALEAAHRIGDDVALAELLEALEAHLQARRAPWPAALHARFRALSGDAAEFARAERLYRDAGMRFNLAVVLLEHAEALAGAPEAEPLAAEARAIFAELRAVRCLERAERLGGLVDGAAHREPAAAVALDAQG